MRTARPAAYARAGARPLALFYLAHDLIRKPVATFRDHAAYLAHDLIRKPVATFRDHAAYLAHDLIRKPVATLRDHAAYLAHDLIRKPVATLRDHALTLPVQHADQREQPAGGFEIDPHPAL